MLLPCQETTLVNKTIHHKEGWWYDCTVSSNRRSNPDFITELRLAARRVNQTPGITVRWCLLTPAGLLLPIRFEANTPASSCGGGAVGGRRWQRGLCSQNGSMTLAPLSFCWHFLFLFGEGCEVVWLSLTLLSSDLSLASSDVCQWRGIYSSTSFLLLFGFFCFVILSQ